MSINLEDIGISDKQNPQVFLKNIIFNDDTQLSPNHNSVMSFSGANNCGKSQVL